MRESTANVELADVSIEDTTPVVDGPAVGLIITEGNCDAVAREVLRALQQNYQVIITYQNEPVLETVDFLYSGNAHVIEPPAQAATEDDLRQTLTTAARSLDFSGMIFHGKRCDQIDYEATLKAASYKEYSTDTVVKCGTPGSPSSGTLVAIPAHNESATIKDVVTAARTHASDVLVIDDGSADETAARAKEAGATVVEHETNSGYGAALKTAFEEADKRRADELVILDGDGQHDPDDIPRFVETLQNNEAEIVIGSRFAAETKMPAYRRLGLSVVNLLTNLSHGVLRSESWVEDTQSGYRAYSRQAIRSLAETDEIGSRMSASTDILYHAHHNDYTIEEVGTTIDYEIEEGSSHHPLSHGIHLVMNIVKTIERDRPITFLGIPGFTSTFAGLGFGYWTLSNYINTGGFPFGLALTSMFFLLAGVFACFTAIILHSLSTQLE
jgi:glycosyltransferase involved in cell wall biosynthesis